MSRQPTAEQALILEAVKAKPPVLVVEAYAGAGKTTTLRMLADVLDEEGQYTAFNTSLVNESKEKFQGTKVSCNTTHSLAFRAEGKRFAKRLNGQRMKSHQVASLLGIDHLKLIVGKNQAGETIEKNLTAAFLAGQVMQCIRRYCQSADKKIAEKHFKYIDGIDQPNEKENNLKVREYLLPFAQKAWKDLSSPKGTLPFSHDVYVKIWQLNKPAIFGGFVLLDESQDSAPVLIDVLKQQSIPVILVGDSCQPAGTMVKVVTGKHKSGKTNSEMTPTVDVPIEELKVGDRVVSYKIPSSFLRRTGSLITGITARLHKGDLIDVSVGDKKTSYTPNHICVVRPMNSLKDKWVVYLQRKGTSFRIGTATGAYASQFGACGPMKRAKREGADAFWILATAESKKGAMALEVWYSHKYNIPMMLFKEIEGSNSQESIDMFWNLVGDITENAKRCLQDHGRMIQYPLWEDTGHSLIMRRSSLVRACNLMNGMEMLPIDGAMSADGKRITGFKWEPITITRRRYVGKVYSMDVENDETYVGDGVITHNCQCIYEWRGAENAANHFPNAPILHLSQSFRFGEAVAAVANAVLNSMSNPPSIPLKGLATIPSRIERVDNPDVILTRTNAVAVTAMLEAIKQGKKPHMIGGGSDVVTFVEAAALLQQGQPTQHPDLACFTSWEEVQEYSKLDEGEDLKLMVKLVDAFTPKTIIEALKGMAGEKEADLTICTAHKSKGREWNKVKLASDFPSQSKSNDSDKRLLYVAVTRAKLVLDISSCPFFAGQDAMDISEALANVKIEEKSPEQIEAEKAAEVLKPALPAPPKEEFTWSNKDGKWLVRGPKGYAGRVVDVVKKNGSKQPKKLISVATEFSTVSLYNV